MGGPHFARPPGTPLTNYYWPSWGAPFLAVPGCSPPHLLFLKAKVQLGYLALLPGRTRTRDKGVQRARGGDPASQPACMHACLQRPPGRDQNSCLYLACVGFLWLEERGSLSLAASPKGGSSLRWQGKFGGPPLEVSPEQPQLSPGLMGSGGVWVSGSQAAAAAAIGVGRN